MTCIVGLVADGDVWIGGDSAGVDGYLGLTVRADQKVFRNGDFIMGFTTSFRMGQLLAHTLTPPKRHSDVDPYVFMVTEFVSRVRDCLKTGGFARKENEVEKGGTFLVGYAKRLFMVESDYQVGEMVDGYAACGCGADIALGSMHSTEKEEPHKRVKMALNAAERHSAGVRGPFKILALNDKEKAK